MAISLTTDWSKIRYVMFVIFFVSALQASTVATGLATSGKQKRQLYREHLLPEQGGKIPDGAFNNERLILNKFSQNGFFSPDGYHIDQRHPDRHHSPKQHLPNTLKVHLYPDNRYVAPPGRYHGAQTVDTTYLIREPYSLKLLRQFKYEKVNNKHHSWNEIQDSDFPAKILKELAPYLRKLHETD